ncbi:MAG: poly-gamma-glutamate biosynthesis protein PgsC/CapC [Alphaproteobacteria bacterium]|nr:poly-gamma-glutamate biosynthesis protein PgsC/CapC [Alphaproteobacteria bacterium]
MILDLFPPSSLDSSILTSVLLGLFVVWLFQEAFGWGFSGLVIPGYLASILVIQPLTGAVVVGEAVVTWAIVEALSERVPSWWPWTRLFGRDRFFNILLVSVAVRLALEGGGFESIAALTGVAPDEDLHSIGLVLVPLIANALWRSGLMRGVPRLGIPLLITWAILEWGFLRYTNLSLSNFELTYEDLALDFNGSARAYILLLVGAALASNLNLRWGWDFGGIIIPGLLTLLWLEPGKIASTLGEAMLISVMYRGALKLPVLRGLELTGGRPLVLCFTMAYLLKFATGWLVPGIWPGLRPTELFGFGYLLPTLVALRIVKYRDALHVIIPCLVTSFVGFLLASGLGYGVAVLMPGGEEPSAQERLPQARLDLVDAAWEDAGELPAPLPRILDGERERLVQAGEGFGALRFNPRGKPIAVSARVGPLGLSAATLAVAEAFDAQVVHLCAPRGPACEQAREALARELDLLVVEAGPETGLHVPGRLPESLDTRALGGLVAELPLMQGEARTTLVLSREDRLEAAAAGAEAPDGGPLSLTGPSFEEDPGQEGWRTPPATQLHEAARTESLREAVLAPWMLWLQRDALSDTAALTANAAAVDMGLTLRIEGTRSLLAGASWRALIDQDGDGTVIVAPDVVSEPDSAQLSAALFEAMGASVIILAAPSEHPLGVDPTRHPMHTTLLSALEQLGPQAQVLVVRGFRDVLAPDADLVLSLSRPLLPSMTPPPVAERVHTLLDTPDWPLRWYDGDPRRLSFQDPSNPVRHATLAATGEERCVTVWASTDYRRALLDGGVEGLQAPEDLR